MRRAMVALSLLASGALVTACGVIGSGNVVDRSVDVGGFDEVEVGGAFNVAVIYGEVPAVTVRADDNVIDRVNVDVDGDTLRIDLDEFTQLTNATLGVSIQTPELSRVAVSGAADLLLGGGVTGEDFALAVSGASEVQGSVDALAMRLDASGASHVELSGTAADLDVEASGGSDVQLDTVAADVAGVHASGASDVDVTTATRLDVVASGAAHVTYGGTGELGVVDTSGAADVQPR